MHVQVDQLQHQVLGLQQSREVQDKELSRLKAEALTLAARTAATASANRESSYHGSPVQRWHDSHGSSSQGSSSGLVPKDPALLR